MSDLPAPLTPPDCDLRGLEYMPLLGHHLFGSEFNAKANDSEWRAGVTLWWSAWGQMPAASLPDDDIALCRLADLGRDLKSWRKIRGLALHGFVKCSDGRLYHPTLAKQALLAWEKRIKERERKAQWRAKKTGPDADVPRDNKHEGAGQTRGQDADVPADGTRRDGTGRDNTPKPPLRILAALPPTRAAVMDAAGFVTEPPDWRLLDAWQAAGADLEQDILPTLRRVRGEVMARSGRNPFKLQLFDQAVRTKLAEDQAEIERLRRTTARLARQDEEQQREAIR